MTMTTWPLRSAYMYPLNRPGVSFFGIPREGLIKAGRLRRFSQLDPHHGLVLCFAWQLCVSVFATSDLGYPWTKRAD